MLILATSLMTVADAAPAPRSPRPRRGLAALFAPADQDGDGVPDRSDHCITLEETLNGYADDDGCPDYLAVLDVGAWAGSRLMSTTLTLERGGTVAEVVGPRVAADLIPGEAVTVTARLDCRVATGRAVIRPGVNRLDLRLETLLDQVVPIAVTDLDGSAVAGVTVTLGTSPCAPAEPIFLSNGVGTLHLGAGAHQATLSAPGFAPLTVPIQPASGEAVQVALTPVPSDPLNG